MKIEEAQLALTGERHAEESRESTETKKVFLDGKWQRFDDVFQRQKNTAGTKAAAPKPLVTISDQGAGDMKALLEKLLLAILDAITRGKNVAVGSCRPACQPRNALPVDSPALPEMQVSYERHERISESECTQFSACGEVRTADGRAVKFDVTLEMSRCTERESAAVGTETYRLTDPLVINFSGKAAELTASHFSFDLNADGQSESIPFVGGGSGFLALDRNGNGKIDDGSELFGALSGNGFADLAALDSNRNGWLDDGDAMFGKLLVWQRDGGESLASLKDKGVGALYVGSVASQFSLKDGDGHLQGAVRATGVYLTEEGGAGTLQQVDLAV